METIHPLTWLVGFGISLHRNVALTASDHHVTYWYTWKIQKAIKTHLAHYVSTTLLFTASSDATFSSLDYLLLICRRAFLLWSTSASRHRKSLCAGIQITAHKLLLFRAGKLGKRTHFSYTFTLVKHLKKRNLSAVSWLGLNMPTKTLHYIYLLYILNCGGDSKFLFK